MSRLLLTLALILAATSLVFGQSMSSGRANLLENVVRVDSIPLSDNLGVDKSPTAKSSAKAGNRNHGLDSVDDKDETEGRFWGSAEYLLWKMKRSNLPPLITTGPDTGDAIIGQPGTVIAFGGGKLDRGRFPGGRFTVGMWLNEKRNVGVEVSYFFLKEKIFNFQVSSSGLPGSQAISRPFFDILSNTEGALFVASPILFQQSTPPIAEGGSSTATSPSQLQGAESNLIYRLNESRFGRMSLLAGFRYLNLKEGLTITDATTLVRNDGNNVHRSDTDQFSTRNQFYGAQFGLRSSFGKHRVSAELEGKVAIGSNSQSVEINGAASSSSPFFTFNARGGLLAVISNIGQYHRNEFTVAPEVKTQLSYNFTHHLCAFVSYDFFYWNKVVRPGEQIDRVLNTDLTAVFGSQPTISSPVRPAFIFNNANFWAQGFSIGIQTHF